MCGFVGVVHLDGTAVEQPVLARMAHAIAHRGPDGEGAYICGQVGFYFKRLADHRSRHRRPADDAPMM